MGNIFKSKLNLTRLVLAAVTILSFVSFWVKLGPPAPDGCYIAGQGSYFVFELSAIILVGFLIFPKALHRSSHRAWAVSGAVVLTLLVAIIVVGVGFAQYFCTE